MPSCDVIIHSLIFANRNGRIPLGELVGN